MNKRRGKAQGGQAGAGAISEAGWTTDPIMAHSLGRPKRSRKKRQVRTVSQRHDFQTQHENLADQRQRGVEWLSMVSDVRAEVRSYARSAPAELPCETRHTR